MRSLLLSAASAVGLLLLVCAFSGTPAAAQASCVVTYDCQGNSGCSSVMGGNVTTRTLTTYANQSACDSAAAQLSGLPTAKCSCGGGGTSDTAGNIGNLISTMTPQQQMGVAVGAVGTLMVLQGLSELMHGKPAPAPDPAAQQRALAAQQLNNSGVYLMKQKNYSGAVNEFQQALAQTPNDANIAKNLAMAKQAQQNSALAQQRSGALGQLLGTTPAGAGNPEYASNSSPLNLVNLNNSNDPGAGELRPPGEAPPVNPAPANQTALQNQIDGALGNQPPAPAPAPTQAQDIDQIFGSPQPAAPPAPPVAQIASEKEQVDNLFAAPVTAPGSTPASAQLVQQASLGQAAANAPTPEAASAMAGQGFDTAAPGTVTPNTPVSQAGPQQTNAPQAPAAAVPSTSSNTVESSPAKQPVAPANQPVVVANLKTPPAPAPEYPITPMREVTSGAAAPGSPIFDCERDRTVIKRMASGLPAQEDAIRRTEEAMKAAKENSEDERKEAMEAAASTLLASATMTASWAQSAIAMAGSLQSNGIGPNADLYKELKILKEVLDDSDKLKDLVTKPAKAYKAGYEYGDTMAVEQSAKTLEEKFDASWKFMKDSGIYEQYLEDKGEHLSLELGGPVGEAAFKTLVNALDLYTHAQQAWNSAAEAEQAEHDLTVMDDQLRIAHGRIYELQQEVVTECSNPKTASY